LYGCIDFQVARNVPKKFDWVTGVDRWFQRLPIDAGVSKYIYVPFDQFDTKNSELWKIWKICWQGMRSYILNETVFRFTFMLPDCPKLQFFTLPDAC